MSDWSLCILSLTARVIDADPCPVIGLGLASRFMLPRLSRFCLFAVLSREAFIFAHWFGTRLVLKLVDHFLEQHEENRQAAREAHSEPGGVLTGEDAALIERGCPADMQVGQFPDGSPASIFDVEQERVGVARLSARLRSMFFLFNLYDRVMGGQSE